MQSPFQHVPPTCAQGQGVRTEDTDYAGSRYSEVVEAVFGEPYYKVWGGPDEQPIPFYRASFWKLLCGFNPFARGRSLGAAAARTLDTMADLRWGQDQKGQRRLIHPNGVCASGIWRITEDNPYTGYFRKGSEGLILGRFSTGVGKDPHLSKGKVRNFSLVLKLYPTTDPNHTEPLIPANIITQDDLGGSNARYISDVELRNTPDVHPLKRGLEGIVPAWLGIVFRLRDRFPSQRQVYSVAELGKEESEPTNAPEYFRFTVAEGQQPRDELDLREEIMAYIFDRGESEPKRTLTFDIAVSNTGKKRGSLLFGGVHHEVENWQRIGTITFDNAVMSYNGDHVLHFHHPPWRNDRNDPKTVIRKR